MPEDIKLDLCAQRTEGDKLFRTFVTDERAWASNFEEGDKENKIVCYRQEDFGVKGRPMFVCSSHDFPLSLKSATWVGKQDDQRPVNYHVTDSTH